MSSLVVAAGEAGVEVISDRRASARSPLFMMVRQHGANDPLWACDIGLGGMQCRGRVARFPGNYLDLSFKLPDASDMLEVGGQVMSLDQGTPGQLTVGVRFCMLSVMAQREIYRFLDRRRALWDEDHVEVLEEDRTSAAAQILAQERPFEAMLLEAYASLRAKEMRRLAFVRNLATGPLPRLSALAVR